MKRTMIGAMTLLVVGTVGVGARPQVSNQQTDRIRSSAEVLTDVRGEPDKDIPRDLWEKAQCVVVVPGLKKAAFGFGGEYGKGMMSCRTKGAFGAPVFMELEKGSWGFQIGGESIDLILLVMNESGMKKMLSDKTSLGADVSVAARSGRTECGGLDGRQDERRDSVGTRGRRGCSRVSMSRAAYSNPTSTPIAPCTGTTSRRAPFSAMGVRLRTPRGSSCPPCDASARHSRTPCGAIFSRIDRATRFFVSPLLH